MPASCVLLLLTSHELLTLYPGAFTSSSCGHADQGPVIPNINHKHLSPVEKQTGNGKSPKHFRILPLCLSCRGYPVFLRRELDGEAL